VSTLTADRIRNHATRLGLTHLTDTLTELVDRAEAAQMGYLDFVDLLLEEEVGLREGRRFRNALKLSGLPHHKTLDQFDFAFQPGLDARKIRDLATLEFVSAKSNVALLGPPGVGKTMLAVALAVGACPRSSGPARPGQGAWRVRHPERAAPPRTRCAGRGQRQGHAAARSAYRPSLDPDPSIRRCWQRRGTTRPQRTMLIMSSRYRNSFVKRVVELDTAPLSGLQVPRLGALAPSKWSRW
jgi:IstB-like ATP binding protein